MTEPIYPFHDGYMDFYPKIAIFFQRIRNKRKKNNFSFEYSIKKQKGQIQIQNVYQRKFHVQIIWFII